MNLVVDIINFEQELEFEYENRNQMLGQGRQSKVFPMLLKLHQQYQQQAKEQQNNSILIKEKELAKVRVAVKMYDIEKQRSAQVRVFMRDLRALAVCHHQNVIHLYGCGAYRANLFLIMERAEPLNIWTFMKDQKQSWKNALIPIKWFKTFAELAEGLHQMAYEKGILHRDLTINNLLIFYKKKSQKPSQPTNQSLQKIIQDEQQLKLQQNQINEPQKDQNFIKGQSQYLEEEKINIKNIQSQQVKFILKISDFGVSAVESDKDKIVRGSCRHYSPEALINKNNYVKESDVYSFGNLLNEMLHCKQIFEDLPTDEAINLILNEKKRPPLSVPCYPEFIKIMNLCWEDLPKNRPTFLYISQYFAETYSNYKILESQKKLEQVQMNIVQQYLISKNNADNNKS